MIKVEVPRPAHRPLAEKVTTLQTEEDIAKFVAQCYKSPNVGNKAMKNIMTNAQRQINLLRLRGPV